MIEFSFSLSYLQIYIIAISIISFGMYGYDKLLSFNNSKITRRISERNLLLSSLLGGTIGSSLGMLIFRHKMKKISFLVKFILIIFVQFIGIYIYGM